MSNPGSFDPALLARLRRTGVNVVGGRMAGRALRRVLEDHAVHVAEQLASHTAVSWAREHPLAPVIVFDSGALDVARDLVRRLDRAASAASARRPVVVVVSDALEQGIAELGWRESTYRVAFARQESVLHDVALALADLLATEPEPAPGAPGLETPMVNDLVEAAFDVDALHGELQARLAWLGAAAERVMSSWVYRFHAPESVDVDATLTVTWRDPAGLRFSLSLIGDLTPAAALFQAKIPRGLRGAIERLREDQTVGDAAFDDAYVVHADEAGLEEAKAARDLLARFPGRLDTLEWTDDAFTARGDDLPREAVALVADAAAQVWHLLVRARLGLR